MLRSATAFPQLGILIILLSKTLLNLHLVQKETRIFIAQFFIIFLGIIGDIPWRDIGATAFDEWRFWWELISHQALFISMAFTCLCCYHCL